MNRYSISLTIILISCAASPLRAEKVEGMFRGEKLDKHLFGLLAGEGQPQHVELTARGVEMRLDGTDGPRQTGIQTRFGVRGDFSISAEFEVLREPVPTKGYGKGFVIRIRSVSDSLKGIAFGRRRLNNGTAVFNTNLTEAADGQTAQDEEFFDTTATKGRLILRRSGNDVYFEVVERKGAPPRRLRHLDFGSDALKEIHFVADNGGDSGELTICLNSCLIEADQLPLGASRLEVRSSVGVWMACCIAGVLAIAAACIVRFKRAK